MNSTRKVEDKTNKKGIRHRPIQSPSREAVKKKEQDQRVRMLGEGLAGKAAEAVIQRKRREEELTSL